MADAFISYRRKPSAPQASLLQEKLKNRHNIDAYLDTTRVDSTKVQFPERLMGAIEDAPTFILMLGDTTLESEWVLKEIQRAYELQKHCIPVFQESYAPTNSQDPAVNYVLNFDAVHLFDVKNIMIDESVANIARLIMGKTPIQPEPVSMIESRVKIAPKAGVMLGAMMVVLVIMALIIVAVLNQPTMPTSDPTNTVESVALVTDELSPTASETVPMQLTSTAMIELSPTLQLTQIEIDAFEIAAQILQTEQVATEIYIALNMTSTATLWTRTPTLTATRTVDITRTVDAALATLRSATQSAYDTEIALSSTPTLSMIEALGMDVVEDTILTNRFQSFPSQPCDFNILHHNTKNIFIGTFVQQNELYAFYDNICFLILSKQEETQEIYNPILFTVNNRLLIAYIVVSNNESRINIINLGTGDTVSIPNNTEINIPIDSRLAYTNSLLVFEAVDHKNQRNLYGISFSRTAVIGTSYLLITNAYSVSAGSIGVFVFSQGNGDIVMWIPNRDSLFIVENDADLICDNPIAEFTDGIFNVWFICNNNGQADLYSMNSQNNEIIAHNIYNSVQIKGISFGIFPTQILLHDDDYTYIYDYESNSITFLSQGKDFYLYLD